MPCPHCKGKGGHLDKGKWVLCEHCGGTGVAGTKDDGVEAFKDVLPDYPKDITMTRSHGGTLFVAGDFMGKKQETADIMFISPAVLEEETGANKRFRDYYTDDKKSQLRRALTGVMRGPSGQVLKNIVGESPLPIDECYYTNVVKHELTQRGARLRPPKRTINHAMPTLENEIKRLKPRIIFCAGKAVFDALWTGKVKFKNNDIEHALLWDPDRKVYLVLVEHITKLISKPETVDKWINTFYYVSHTYERIRGKDVVPDYELDYRVIENSTQLREWVDLMRSENRKLFAVDCEWGSRGVMFGNLRSVQFCWDNGKAVFIKFMEPIKGEQTYTFDIPYEEAGAILWDYMKSPDVKFIGHVLCEDFVWLEEWLKFDCYKKAAFDTAFALNCINEYDRAGLEIVSMRYTDLGRYDIWLMIHRKENKYPEDTGFGLIPHGKEFVDYSCKDVDVPFRAYPALVQELLAQDGLFDYYMNQHLPYVTDLFTNFMRVGIPMDVERMKEMRVSFKEASNRLQKMFLEKMIDEARSLLLQRLMSEMDAADALTAHADLWETFRSGLQEEARDKFFDVLPHTPENNALFAHILEIDTFKLGSIQKVRRWLYDVKGHTPLKSTAKPEEGVPAIPWEKVMSWPPEKRKGIEPAADKSVIKVLAEKDPILHDVMRLNKVTTVTKNFLRDDDENGKPRGLFKWVAERSGNRVHPHLFCTESARPRSRDPNVLNWNKSAAKEIEMAFEFAYRDLTKEQRPPVYALRSCAAAPPGWCFVETDLQTAEVVTLAYLSGDNRLLSAVLDPDVQFAQDKDGKVYRICYADYCGVSEENRDPAYLHDPDDPRWLRDDDGKLIHPKRDLHWEAVEHHLVINHPREWMIPKYDGKGKDVYRNGIGKVGNFQLQYGAGGPGIEQSIEAVTLVKPAPGIGEAIIQAFAARFPDAARYQEERAMDPQRDDLPPGVLPHYQSPAGRIRHFYGFTPAQMEEFNISSFQMDKVFAALGREARNFPQQNMVAEHMARAGCMMLQEMRERGMKARPCVLLYDALNSLCPMEERHEVFKLHQKYMSDVLTWPIRNKKGEILRRLRFDVDNEFVFRWSVGLSTEEKSILYSDN